MNSGGKAMQQKAAQRKADQTAAGKRIKASELEMRADAITRNIAVMQMEAMKLYAMAAALRRESDGGA